MSKLYFARVAPVEPQKDQLNGGGWAWRYKVRIIDKHTQDKKILPDEKLPWAQVLLPVTAGSGAANYSQSPVIKQGDTVSVAYYDEDEQQPVITGILPRTDEVSIGKVNNKNGYQPHTGYSKRDKKSPKNKIPKNETNESNKKSQKTKKSKKFFSGTGDQLIPADGCDPDAYKVNAIVTEIQNLINQVQQFKGDKKYIKSLQEGSIDRIHAILNTYVGDMINYIFRELIPILNAGLKALYRFVFAQVFAATGSYTAARLAAEATLMALRPPIVALQKAIAIVAAKVVKNMLPKVKKLVREVTKENTKMTTCSGAQFTGSLMNVVMKEVDKGLDPLLDAVSRILSFTQGFNTLIQLRATLEAVSDVAAGMFNKQQGQNKCGGMIRKYVVGYGEAVTRKDLLGVAHESANIGDKFGSDEFGDFPFRETKKSRRKRRKERRRKKRRSKLDNCNADEPDICLGPTVKIFGGRGRGAKARAIIGQLVPSEDPRTITPVQGGVIAVEVLDGGEDYIYPPHVEIVDECGLGIGAVARSVIDDNGRVIAIYIVDPGELYPVDNIRLVTVGSVQVIDGGSGYPQDIGIIEDDSGTQYSVIVNEDGEITDVTPINIIEVDDIPDIDLPTIFPEPPDGVIVPDEDPGPIVVNGKRYNIGTGAILAPVLVPIPTAEEILDGNIPQDLRDRYKPQELLEIIDCIEH